MSKLALIEYEFIFDPSETWSNLHQFENQLAKYFDHLGLSAEVVAPMSSQKRVILIKAKPEPVIEEAESTASPKEQADRLRNG